MALYSESKYFVSYISREDLTKQINDYCRDKEICIHGISHFEAELSPEANEPIKPPAIDAPMLPELNRVLVFTAIIFYNKRG